MKWNKRLGYAGEFWKSDDNRWVVSGSNEAWWLSFTESFLSSEAAKLAAKEIEEVIKKHGGK